MNLRNEIERHASADDKPVLLWLLSKYSRESRWSFVATCSHRRYGTLSYETNRVWIPTNEGRILYRELSGEGVRHV